MSSHTLLTDALATLAQLSSEQLLARLAELYAEQEQVRALLRVARARERAERTTRRPVAAGGPSDAP